MINMETRDFILKNNRIPKPSEIDPNSRFILCNPTLLHKIIDLMTPDDSMCFQNIKYMLSDQIKIEEIKTFRIFDKIPPKSAPYILELNPMSLLKHQKNIFDKYYAKFIESNKKLIESLFT